jgi:Na+:H+ antiporter, NhaA family
LSGKDFDHYVKLETYSAILLVVSALAALVVSNTGFYHYYHDILHGKHALNFGSLDLGKHSVLHFINDGLMALFFLLVGLEMKREMISGELKTRAKMMLPVVAAVGGMVVPALIFIVMNLSHPEHMSGWAIPVATDIAFSLGILSLIGSRVPSSLKVFLTALAIFDDLGAVIIIAVYYTQHIHQIFLLFSLMLCVVLWLINRSNVDQIWVYLLIGFLLWFCILLSGVHPTLAGIAVAFAVPMRGAKKTNRSPLKILEKKLHLWVTFGVLPLFAFANAGVHFSDLTWADVLSPLTMGIAVGLFVGKQLGIFGFSFAAIKCGLARRPAGMTNRHLYGLSLLAGMGFTMSLFIGSLAFGDSDSFGPSIRTGVLIGSFASAVLGYLILRFGKSA